MVNTNIGDWHSSWTEVIALVISLLTAGFYIHSPDVAGWYLFPMRTSLMTAVSILEEYNANHIGKLVDYIKLHVFESVPLSCLSCVFKENWGSFVDVHQEILPLDCPDIIFMMSILQPAPVGTGFGEDDGVDSWGHYLHNPAQRHDVDNGSTIHYPMLHEAIGVETTVLSQPFPVPGDDVDQKTVMPIRAFLKDIWKACFLRWLVEGKEWT